MPGNSARFGFLKSRPAQVLSVVLVAQTIGLYAISRQEKVPLTRSLEEFPLQFGDWRMFRAGVVEQEIRDVLKADDILNRTYADASNHFANLFVAFFRSQRTGQAPHSPKNCLPGSGWVPSESEIVSVQVPGLDQPIRVNRYVVAKGDDKSVVLYWYQSHNRVVASEYHAKFYVVADAIRYNRTDTALVRVVVPVLGNQVAAATTTAEQFVQSFFLKLKEYLPS